MLFRLNTRLIVSHMCRLVQEMNHSPCQEESLVDCETYSREVNGETCSGEVGCEICSGEAESWEWKKRKTGAATSNDEMLVEFWPWDSSPTSR